LQAQKTEGGVRVGVGKLKVGVIPLGWRSRLQKTRKQHIRIKIGTDKSLGKNLMMHLKEWTTQQGKEADNVKAESQRSCIPIRYTSEERFHCKSLAYFPL